MRRLAAALDRYWFAPALLRDLALVRILAFGTQTLILVVPPVGHLAWVSSLRPLSEHLHQLSAGETWYQPSSALKLLLLPWGEWGTVRPSAALITAAFWVAVVAGVLATVGLFARVGMLAAAAANVLLVAHWYSYGEFHHAESMMMVALGVLALAPSAAVWSVDAWWRRRSGGAPSPRATGDDSSPFARWPLQLMQWLIALTYLSAAGEKLHHGGARWVNGYTLSYHYLSIGLARAHAGALFMASLPPYLLVVPSAFALLFELTFVLAVLLPRTAWLYVLAGTGFHLVIYLTMGVSFIQTIVLYGVFVESLRRHRPAALRWPPRWLQPGRGQPTKRAPSSGVGTLHASRRPNHW